MKCTLITSIGTGMYKEGYRPTVYKFNDGDEQKTNWFLQALINKKYRDFSNIILIGTNTSNWDALIDLNDESATGLWEQLCSLNTSKIGISSELVEPLQDQLTKQYGIPVKVFIHTDKIDWNTTGEVFNTYHSIIPYVPKDTDILLDITHGFRSMPILMFQTLQLVFSRDNTRKVELVYGEFIKDKAVSYVRDLTNFWYLSQISDALNLFETKLDGNKLSELIKEEWPSGSKAIKKLSDVVQTNFALQFPDVVKQIKNSLNDVTDNVSAWVSETRQFLEKIKKLMDEKSISRTLYNYSRFLYSKKLNTQAVITLQVAVETAIVEKYGNVETDLGNYDWVSNTGHEQLKKLRNQNFKELDCLFNLERFRNQIAHGGGKNGNAGYPSVANIPAIYQSGEKGLLNLYSILNL